MMSINANPIQNQIAIEKLKKEVPLLGEGHKMLKAYLGQDPMTEMAKLRLNAQGFEQERARVKKDQLFMDLLKLQVTLTIKCTKRIVKFLNLYLKRLFYFLVFYLGRFFLAKLDI